VWESCTLALKSFFKKQLLFIFYILRYFFTQVINNNDRIGFLPNLWKEKNKVWALISHLGLSVGTQ
jgi:hypothetical protein